MTDKKLTGKGSLRIETEMNQESVWKPPKSNRNKTGGWRESYVNKILRSKAVIGQFQPCSKGQPVGEPILNYFPAVIDGDLFYQVHAQLQANARLNGNAGGRIGKASNLFTHVAKCGLCGNTLQFVDKGKPPKGYQYLYCDASRRLKTCPAKPVRYDEFEKLFFQNFEELDISQLIPAGNETQARLNALESHIIANQQRISGAEIEIENLTDSISRTQDSRVREQLEKRLSKGFDSKEFLVAEIKQSEREITELKQQQNGLEKDV